MGRLVTGVLSHDPRVPSRSVDQFDPRPTDPLSALTGRPRAHHKTGQHVPWCPNTESNKNVFSFLRNESVDRRSRRSVGSLFHVRGAAIRLHVRCMTRSLLEARAICRACRFIPRIRGVPPSLQKEPKLDLTTDAEYVANLAQNINMWL